jgi:hypothetical protein
LDWSEDRDAPYFTDRPGWDGYSGLVLLAAHTATNTPLPAKLPKHSLNSDILLRAQGSNFKGGYRSITQAQLWLPGSFEFSFDFVDPCNQKTHIGSVRRLKMDLAALQTAHQLTNEQMQVALRDAYEDPSNFESVSRFGLAIFSRIAAEAEANHLPILLSY